MGKFVWLEKDQHVELAISVDPPGFFGNLFSKCPNFRFCVEGSEPISTYIVDSHGLDAFKKGTKDIGLYSHGGFRGIKDHKQTVYLPHDGTWYILIVNWSKEKLVVWYDSVYINA
jgi:hypothetical protein